VSRLQCSRACGSLPGVLIDAETNAAGLEERCIDMPGAAVFEQISQNRVDFDRSAFFQVSVHGRGEVGFPGGDCLAQEGGERLRERESAGGAHGCALIDSMKYGLLAVRDSVDLADGAVKQTRDKTE
jgi:hypothetical protein